MKRLPTQERSRAVVRRLLAASEQLFAERGYELATVRDIAAEAGVPKGSLYQFFQDKAAVLDALVADYLAAVDEIFDALDDAQQMPDPGGTVGPVEATTAYVAGSVVRLASDRPAFRTVFAGLAAAGPLADAGELVRNRFRDRIDLALALGMPRATGRRRAAEVCTEITRGLLPKVVDHHRRVDDEMAGELETVLAVYLEHVKIRD